MIIPTAVPVIRWDQRYHPADSVDPTAAGSDESAVAIAARLALELPIAAELLDFAAAPGPAGALLVRGIRLPDCGPTPAAPGVRDHRWTVAELTLLAAARLLGHPIGYAPEHGGRLVQDIVPVRGTESLQVSTSSSTDLMFHTETAFHPHRPRHLLLLCVRGDPAAATTLLSVNELIRNLDPETVGVLRGARFRTAVDSSFLNGRENRLGPPHPIVAGAVEDPTLLFDADLTVGTDDEASAAVQAVLDVIVDHHRAVVLEAGDLLVVDNHRVVHGRSAYTPRYDGTDRWLMRAFTVADLTPSAPDRVGRVITTVFGAELPSAAALGTSDILVR